MTVAVNWKEFTPEFDKAINEQFNIERIKHVLITEKYIAVLNHCNAVLKECLKDASSDMHPYINGCIEEINKLNER